MGTTTFTWAISLALLGLSPPEYVATDRVDVIEVNHFYDEHGKLVFDQILYYEWSAAQSRYNVRAWRLLKSPAQVPQRDWERGDFVARFYDGDALREIRAATVRESWTQYDPELIEREYLPKEQRRELRTLHSSRKTLSLVVAREAKASAP